MFHKIQFHILLAFLFINYVDLALIIYNIKLKGIDETEGIKNPVWNLRDLKMKKMNKTHYALNGHYSVLRDDVAKEDLKMNFYVDHKKGNGYESVSLINLRKADYCEKWDHEQMVFPAIKKSINETDYPCPPKKGHYALINYIPDTSKIPPGMPEGLYRLTFEYFDKEEIVGGYKIYADVTEEAKVD